MPQAATSVDAAMRPCPPQLTSSEGAAVSAEKTRSRPSGGECQDERSSPRGSCRSQEFLADDPSNCRSPSGGPRKLLRDSSGAPQVIPLPSDGSTTGRTLGSVQRDILRMAYNRGGLKFGSFTLKSGRQSPFFFNSGCFSDGEAVELIAKAYAMKIVESGIPFDVLFGPAYKGIPLVACTALVLAREYALPAPFAYDRKEPKDHGEGGQLVGAIEAFGRKPLGGQADGRKEDSRNEESSSGTSGESSSSSSKSSKVSVSGGVHGDTDSHSNNSSSGSSSSVAEKGGCAGSSSTGTRPARVIVLDDVLTAGSAIRASVTMLRKDFPDLEIPALCFLLDRQERGALGDRLTASQELEAEMKTKVLSVLQMADILKFLEELIAAGGAGRARLEESRRNLRLYLEEFGGVSVK